MIVFFRWLSEEWLVATQVLQIPQRRAEALRQRHTPHLQVAQYYARACDWPRSSRAA